MKTFHILFLLGSACCQSVLIIPFPDGNCNCALPRLAAYTSGFETVEQCAVQCEAKSTCASFGVWTSTKGFGTCALFSAACTSPCEEPTDVANGYTNDVFNMNRAPRKEFCDLQVTGSRHYQINGLYIQDGTTNGKPFYQKEGDEMKLYWWADLSNWHFHLAVESSASAYASQDVATPKDVTSGWKEFDNNGWAQARLSISCALIAPIIHAPPYLGCYIDSNNRALSGPSFLGEESLTIESCNAMCSNYVYFGVQNGDQCYCGNDEYYDKHGTSQGCTEACTGNSEQDCGGYWAITIYATETGSTCRRGERWCTHDGSTFTSYDCDGDGLLDNVCYDTGRNKGVQLTSQGCGDNFPDARFVDCPVVFEALSCEWARYDNLCYFEEPGVSVGSGEHCALLCCERNDCEVYQFVTYGSICDMGNTDDCIPNTVNTFVEASGRKRPNMARNETPSTPMLNAKVIAIAGGISFAAVVVFFFIRRRRKYEIIEAREQI